MNKKLFMTNIKLTGVSLGYAQDVIKELVLGKNISRFTLTRDENNKFDESAVMVRCLSFFLGWIPADRNFNLAFEMDEGKFFEAELVRILEQPYYRTRGVVINIVEIGWKEGIRRDVEGHKHKAVGGDSHDIDIIQQ